MGVPAARYIDGEGLVVVIVGDLDISTGDEIVADVTHALSAGTPAKRLVLDVSGVPFVDSSGLFALLRMRYAANDHGLALVLRNPTAQLIRVLEVAGLTSQFATA